MKILEILQKLEKQQQFFLALESAGVPDSKTKEALDSSTATITKAYEESKKQAKEILSKKEAKKDWQETVNVKQYVDKIISLLSQIATLSKKECEETIDIQRLEKIYYLIHNSIPKVSQNLDMLKMFNIDKNSKDNADIYKALQTYILFDNPSSLDALQSFYENRKAGGGIPIESYLSAADDNGVIEQFFNFLVSSSGLDKKIVNDLRAMTGTRSNPSRGQYEVLLSILSKGGYMNKGHGGDVIIESESGSPVGLEIKADNSIDGKSAGRLGGQRSGFQLTVSTLSKELRNIVKTYADTVLKPYISKAKSKQKTGARAEVEAQQPSIEEVYKKYTSMIIAINPGYVATKDKCSLDQALIEITKAVPQEGLTDVMPELIKAIENAWTIFIIESKDNPMTGASISTIKSIIRSFLAGLGLNDILNSVFNRQIRNKPTPLSAIFNEAVYDKLIKIIGFTVLSFYANEEKFNYCFVINTAVDRLVIVDMNKVNRILGKVKEDAIATADELMAAYPGIVFLPPQTYGSQGPRAGFGITTL